VPHYFIVSSSRTLLVTVPGNGGGISQLQIPLS